MSPVNLAVVLLLCAAAASATETLSVRTRPGRCLILRLESASAVTLDAVQPASASVSMTSVRGTANLESLDERCRPADIALGEGELQTYVALLNDGQIPAYAVIKVTHEALSMPSSSKPPSAARVSRTVREGSIAASRWLDSSAEAAGAMLGLGETAAWKGERRGEPVVLRAPSIRRHRRQLAQSTSPTPTPTATPASIQSQVENEISNSLSPNQKHWIKIAIIIGIVVAALCLLSLVCCLVRCICWPCCCIARSLK